MDQMDRGYIKAPIDKNALCYNMRHKRRGDAIIFHHVEFDSNLELNKRENDKDLLEKLRQVLKDLDFEVIVYEDFTFKEIAKIIRTRK